LRLIERHARRPSAAGRRVRRGRERRSFQESVKQDRQQKDEGAYSGVLEMAAQPGRAACDPEQGRHLARLSILGGCRAGSRSEGSEVVGSQRENSLTVLTPGCWRCVPGNRPATPCGEDSTRREAARSYRELNSSWRAGGVKPGLEGRYGRRFPVLFQPGTVWRVSSGPSYFHAVPNQHQQRPREAVTMPVTAEPMSCWKLGRQVLASYDSLPVSARVLVTVSSRAG